MTSGVRCPVCGALAERLAPITTVGVIAWRCGTCLLRFWTEMAKEDRRAR